MNHHRLGILLCLLLAGCATSKSARQLAMETAVAVQTLDAAISQQATSARAAAASSDARIANQLWRSAAAQAELALELELDPTVKADFERLRSFADKHEAERQKLLAAAGAQIQALSEARQQLDVPADALRSMSDNLAVLGKRESRRQRLTRSLQFVSDVSQRVRDNAEAAKKAAAEAKLETDEATGPKN